MDDRQTEEYLRGFRPLCPAPLPRRKRQWRLIALGAAAALITGVLLLPLLQSPRVPAEPAVPQPITIGSANQMLAGSSSWKQAIDDAGFAFNSSRTNVVPLPRSGLEFLSQEDLSK